MRLEFDLNNNVEMPEIILGKRNYDKLGSILNINSLTFEYNLMSADSISFTVYKELNNETERLWDEIKERRCVYLKEFDEWFQIDVVTNDEGGVSKEITGTSLCEAELSQIYIRSTEINTEADIAREAYINPTIFYKPANPEESLLHRLLKEAPNYTIKHVDLTLYNIQRMFSIDGTTIYDELTGEIAEEIGCLFLFDSTDRSISVYDLKTNCNHCGYRGDYTDICPECGSTDLNYGYGNDTTIFVDSETLAENISLSGNQDEVKNYIKVSGGDDLINTAIAACNPTGTQYIYTWSDRDKEDMSAELSAKLEEYLSEYARLTPSYQEIMENIYDAIDKQLELESNMMPDIQQAETTAKQELSKLTASNLNPIAVQDVSVASIYTVNNAILGMAKCVINSTVYKVEIADSSLTSQTWNGKFRLTNYSDEEDTAENTSFITITINDDYAYYIEQKIRKTIDRDDVYLVDIFDVKTDLNVFKAELKKYCLNRLTSFESAYQSVIDVLIEANCGNESIYGDIYNDLYLPYYNKLTAIQQEITIRIAEIEAVDTKLSALEESRSEITQYLNLETYLGSELWKELCLYRREDYFENSNYISDGLDNSELLQKAQELLDKAKLEAVTASTLQMSISTTLINLLAIPEFSKLTGMFEGGNWIRVGMDDKIYRLRLIHYKIDFANLQNLEVEFSDVTQTANGLNDTKNLMDKVNSMSSSFSYVAHQAEQGAKSFTELDTIRNDGLNAALYNISSSVNQDFIIDEHGITGRQWDDVQGAYLPEQVKFTNNCLVYTDDYWVTAKSALGKIQYYHPILKEVIEQYGLLADAVIAGILIGNDIVGGNIYSENYSSTAGTYINLNDGSFTFGGGKFIFDAPNDQMTMRGVTIEWDSTSPPEITNINGLTEQLSGIQNDLEQLDGRIQTFSQTSDPSIEWITNEDNQNHIGDLWYNPDTSITQRWNGTTWEKTTDSDLTNLAQSKAQIFTTTPSVPYYVGDLWVQGSSGDILNCINTRASGNYTASDWAKSSKYTDDTALTTFVNGSYKETLLDIETQIDGKARSWYQSTDPSLSWDTTSEDHEGDLWYNTSDDSHVTYIYQNAAWRATNVPKELFDTIDGIASIYVTVPSNPVVGDLLIPTTDTEMYIEGKVYKYNGTNWAEIAYTDDTAVTNLDTKISQILAGAYTTTIGEDYIISPHIGGGYLNITGVSGTVLIDPQKLRNSSYIFAIHDSSNTIVLGVDTSGNANFKGNVTTNNIIATGGTIGGWTITSGKIYAGDETTGVAVMQYPRSSITWVFAAGGTSHSAYADCPFRVSKTGELYTTNITATGGTIGGWSLNATSIYRNYSTYATSGGMYFGTSGLSIGSLFRVSNGGILQSGTNTDYVTLNNGSLKFYTDGNAIASFSDVYWSGTEICGTAVHSEYNSKFISFGNKASSTATSYTTKFLINYGLNPNSMTQGVQVFSDLYVSSDIVARGNVSCTTATFMHSSGNVTVTATNVSDSWQALKADGFYTSGNLYVGGDKNRVVNTDHYGAVCLSAYETATPYFGDIGSGICDEYGLCYVYLDEIFKETVMMDCKYYVFLQQIGESGISLIEQNKDYFVVKGEPNQEFNFEIKCRQKGTEAKRLEGVYFEESEVLIE